MVYIAYGKAMVGVMPSLDNNSFLLISSRSLNNRAQCDVYMNVDGPHVQRWAKGSGLGQCLYPGWW